jgi:hypothetical protein
MRRKIVMIQTCQRPNGQRNKDMTESRRPRASQRSSQMAKQPTQPQQGGAQTPSQQQGQQSGSTQQQGSQPVFRDWAAI